MVFTKFYNIHKYSNVVITIKTNNTLYHYGYEKTGLNLVIYGACKWHKVL